MTADHHRAIEYALSRLTAAVLVILALRAT